ncbi:NAD-binding Rossmann fold oxidoreductase [Xylogone sp. PMI_703]|nr:NAD-binding Rossmann fold oxidoreductase [Xylogone sp. PMI_703]
MDGIALIGAGIYPREAYLPPLHAIKATVVALYSRSKKSVSELLEAGKDFPGLYSPDIKPYDDEAGGDHSGIVALLQNPAVKAVIIALPTPVQPAVAEQCLAAGKHVLMEKPITKDVASATDLITSYEKNYASKGLILSVAEQFRFDPALHRAHAILSSSKIGTLRTVHARIWQAVEPGNKWYETPWRKHPAYQGGFLLDGGVHFVALLRLVSGDEIVETRSFAKQTWKHLPPLDTVQAAIRFGEGAIGTLSMSFASVKGEYEYVFVGEKGSLTISGAKGGTKLVVEEKGGSTETEVVSGESTYRELFSAYGESIRSGKVDVRGAPRQALADVAVVESLCSGGGTVGI